MAESNEYYENARYLKKISAEPSVDKHCAMKKLYKMGEEVGNGFKFWRETESKLRSSNKKLVRFAEFICPVCDELKEMPINSIINNDAKSCGCVAESRKKENNAKE